ncbi:uncharacterized protein LOC103315197 [Tribolium castaneum]|uniref:HAUS augmin-like complex subunit 6 N-terminal domain-containing protein n=1 Tax=Tribolium castaneum TaxID=7070 RepID=D6WAS3_TRICA|nr:PREDICTED: uncharacterized protein LOC103315197 [Tribolium castaneum]XP_008201488.1 PREDICTED: uncharacterized protein LOC103315197 [Tribolium castaneum]EEZ97959.1 hypothetical protein TcasGA2_TC000350 [Tribolium castaneum]|eukprot:XP_008201487.1 PREDICTED: uncharacterized protein LOC103315197 [Tribolium castaneum]
MASFSVINLQGYEAIIHEKLFANIKQLTYVYPPTQDFHEVFREDMFKKNNKAAFQQVTNYLFNVLSPELTREKLKSWPPYDTKGEREFRQEVVAFVDYLNENYKAANIPKLMPSLFVSPGGIKVAKFMFKLSTFVLHEHLKKNMKEGKLLSPIRPCKNPAVNAIIIENLNRTTSVIKKRTSETATNFHKFSAEAFAEAQRIVEQVERIKRQEMAEVTKALDEEKKKNLESIDLEKLQGKMAQMENIKSMCERANELLDVIMNDNQLELDKENTPDLDLLQLFNDLNEFLEKERFQIPTLLQEDMKDMVQRLSELTENYKQLIINMEHDKKELEKLAENSVI